MTLEFHDGALQVSPTGAPRKAPKSARPVGADPAPRQGDLF
jgi:hypothetical protein